MNSHPKTKLRLLTNTANNRTLEKEVRVTLSKFVQKQIERLPLFIHETARVWIEEIKRDGLAKTRERKGYHDEPLKGLRRGQRSIRLNRSWRLIYKEEEFENRTWISITVIEVNKHAY